VRLCLSLFLMLLPCWAKSGRAELFGGIQDPSGSVVAGAKVQLQETGTGARFLATSDDRGNYHFLGLPPGEYVLTVEGAGFRPYKQSGMMLRLGDKARLDITLQLGSAIESVEVTATAPLLETATGEVGYTVDETKASTLPLDGRNFIPLIALAPGVALPGGGSLLPRINGSRPRTNEYIYDGISVLQPEPGQVAFYPVIDGIEEFRLDINSYSPEYGRSNGGAVMVIGKSGGNEFHGSGFEFFRNEALNARNYFAQPGPKPEVRGNQYGLTLGGPVQKNKTFFFGDWQGTRLLTGITRFSTVPTVDQRRGQFATTIVDPATGQAFAKNSIPESQFDPIVRQVLAHYPEPNLPGAASNYVRTAVEPDHQDQ